MHHRDLTTVFGGDQFTCEVEHRITEINNTYRAQSGLGAFVDNARLAYVTAIGRRNKPRPARMSAMDSLRHREAYGASSALSVFSSPAKMLLIVGATSHLLKK